MAGEIATRICRPVCRWSPRWCSCPGRSWSFANRWRAPVPCLPWIWSLPFRRRTTASTPSSGRTPWKPLSTTKESAIPRREPLAGSYGALLVGSTTPARFASHIIHDGRPRLFAPGGSRPGVPPYSPGHDVWGSYRRGIRGQITDTIRPAHGPARFRDGSRGCGARPVLPHVRGTVGFRPQASPAPVRVVQGGEAPPCASLPGPASAPYSGHLASRGREFAAKPLGRICSLLNGPVPRLQLRSAEPSLAGDRSIRADIIGPDDFRRDGGHDPRKSLLTSRLWPVRSGRARRDRLRIYSPWSTASPALLAETGPSASPKPGVRPTPADSAHCLFDIVPSRLQETAGIDFVRTIGTDDLLALQIVQELERTRRHRPAERNAARPTRSS